MAFWKPSHTHRHTQGRGKGVTVWLKNSLRHLLATAYDLPRGFRGSSLGENETLRKWSVLQKESELRLPTSSSQRCLKSKPLGAAVGETEARVSAH